MASIFDNLSDKGSDDVFYDSEFEQSEEGDSEPDEELEDSDEEDPNGPDLWDPDLPIPTPIYLGSAKSTPSLAPTPEPVQLRVPTPLPSLNTSQTSLPIIQPKPIRPGDKPTNLFSVQALEALADTAPKAVLQTSAQNTIGARISALALWSAGVPYPKIKELTGVSESGVYKLRTKARDRG